MGDNTINLMEISKYQSNPYRTLKCLNIIWILLF